MSSQCLSNASRMRASTGRAFRTNVAGLLQKKCTLYYVKSRNLPPTVHSGSVGAQLRRNPKHGKAVTNQAGRETDRGVSKRGQSPIDSPI